MKIETKSKIISTALGMVIGLIIFSMMFLTSCSKDDKFSLPQEPCVEWVEDFTTRIPDFKPSGLEYGNSYVIYCEYDKDTTAFGSLSNLAQQFKYEHDTDLAGIINLTTCESGWIVEEAQIAQFSFYKCDKYGHRIEKVASWRNPINGAYNTQSVFSYKVRLILN